MNMSEISSYINYLPPILWSNETDQTQFLGRMLRIFEKILTGIPDGIAIGSDSHPYEPLETTIENLYRLFDPYTTPANQDKNFLRWLASWVALTLRNDLSEYQQRKRIADIAPIYRQRGLKAGLLAYLELFSVTKVRPRIVIDAGEALFYARFLENGAAQLHPIAYSTNFPLPNNGVMTALLHPSALAVDTRHNAYIIADLGDSTNSQNPLQPAIWRIAANTGAFEYTVGTTPAPPLPKPLYLRNQAILPTIDAPVAIVVETVTNNDRYCVLDAGVDATDTAIYRLTAPAFAPIPVIDKTTTTKRFTAVMPMDMIQDRDHNFVVLDRGVRLSGDPPLGGPSKPKLIIVKEGPLNLEEHALDTLPDTDPGNVIEPTALVMDAQGRYIVADARDQFSTKPANLVRVDPANGWSQHALLPDAGNPLVYPTGLVFESPQSLLVCDTGLRNGFEDGDEPSFRALAEPPALYRVDLAQSPPKISKITTAQPLVSPTKMAIDQNGNVIISDRGEVLRGTQPRNWRTQPHEFGVIIHFSIQRPGAADPEQARRVRNQMRYTIANMIDEQKPGHVSFWPKS
jgi:phage tail-like protein